MNSAFDDAILGAETDPVKEKSCFERTDIHLIIKLSLFYSTEPSETLALHFTYYSWKYVLIPKQLFYLMHICFTDECIERDILKQSYLAYLKWKGRREEQCSEAMK